MQDGRVLMYYSRNDNNNIMYCIQYNIVFGFRPDDDVIYFVLQIPKTKAAGQPVVVNHAAAVDTINCSALSLYYYYYLCEREAHAYACIYILSPFTIESPDNSDSNPSKTTKAVVAAAGRMALAPKEYNLQVHYTAVVCVRALTRKEGVHLYIIIIRIRNPYVYYKSVRGGWGGRRQRRPRNELKYRRR